MLNIFKRKKIVKVEKLVPEIDLSLDKKYTKELNILKKKMLIEYNKGYDRQYLSIREKLRTIYHFLVKFNEYNNLIFDPKNIDEIFETIEDKKQAIKNDIMNNIKSLGVDNFWQGTSLSTFNKILSELGKSNNGDDVWLKKEIEKYYNEYFMVMILKFVDE